MTTSYVLPPRLEGDALDRLRGDLLARRGADLDLSGGEVQRLNGLGLQTLLSAFRTWREDGFRLRLTDPSPPLFDAFARLGLTAMAGGIGE